MNTLLLAERTLTNLDHARLTRLLAADARSLNAPPLAALRTTLDAADLVPAQAVPPDVVTMYTRVQLVDPDSGRQQTLTLCYPEDAEPAEGFVSALSPVGSALLGLRVGALARWLTPRGDTVQARVAAILFQPEASGDFVL